MDKLPLPNDRNIKTDLIHLPVPSLVMVNETEQRWFFPSADTLIYTVFPKSGLLGQADATSPITTWGVVIFVSSQVQNVASAVEWNKSQTHAKI